MSTREYGYSSLGLPTTIVSKLRKTTMTYQARIRQLHRSLAPVMLLPLLLTLFTGAVYQLVDSAGKGDDLNGCCGGTRVTLATCT